MSQTSHASRIIGLDMARALAIVGMIVVHMASLLWSTKLVLNGIPAALFAVIAGATLMIIGRRFSLNAWLRIIARGGIIMLIGLAMLPVGGWIQVVLVAMGLTMILVSWVPPLNVWWKVALFIAATAAATVRYAPFTLPQIYPLLAWIAYFLAGMILYEVYLRGTTAEGFAPGRTRAIVRWAFSAVSLVVTGMGMYLRFEPEMPSWPRVGGHTGVLGEIVLAVAVSAVVLHLCLLAGTAARAMCYPLAALGSMSLTVYVLHVLTANYWQSHVAIHNTWSALGFIVVFLVLATVWKKFVGQGPLEKLVSFLVRAIAPAAPAASISNAAAEKGNRY